MQTNQEKIDPKTYLSGKEFVKRLIEITDCKQQQYLSEVFDVPKSTVSTWIQRGLTPHEIAVRTHLHTGVSLQWLLLGEGEPYPDKKTQMHTSKQSEPKSIFDVNHFSLVNGKLVGNETLTFDRSYLDKLAVSNVMSIENEGTTYLIDKDVQQAVSGTYLVDMDGLLSLNQIQRLPGKKLAISFNGSTLAVEEDEVKVVGRVTLIMEKK